MTMPLPSASPAVDDRRPGKDTLAAIFVETDEVLALFRAFDELIAEPATATNGKGIAVLGPLRCGKTSLVSEYIDRCRNGYVETGAAAGVKRRPLKVLWVSLIPGTRLNMIAGQTLHELDHPAPFKGGHDARTVSVVREIVQGGYGLVVFDEIHHLVSSDNPRVRENASHWLTHVLDRTRCPMALVGYEGFGNILKENGFLSGRLVPAPALKRYVADEPKSFATFRMVLASFETFLDFPLPSRLSEPDIAARILVLCDGRLGFLENFLTSSREIARRMEHNCIRHEVLREAAEGVMRTWCKLRFNPFEVDDLAAASKKFGTAQFFEGELPSTARRAK